MGIPCKAKIVHRIRRHMQSEKQVGFAAIISILAEAPSESFEEQGLRSMRGAGCSLLLLSLLRNQAMICVRRACPLSSIVPVPRSPEQALSRRKPRRCSDSVKQEKPEGRPARKRERCISTSAKRLIHRRPRHECNLLVVDVLAQVVEVSPSCLSHK